MNKSKKWFCLVLVTLLLCTMVMPASAASVGWTDPDGTYNVAIVTKISDWYYVYKPIVDATIARHTVGTPSLVTWPVGNTASHGVIINAGVYKNKVEQALMAEGLTTIIHGAARVNDEGFDVVPASAPTGTYSFGYEITAYDISWRVDLDAPQSGGIIYAVPAENQSGTVDAVPESITAIKLIPYE